MVMYLLFHISKYKTINILFNMRKKDLLLSLRLEKSWRIICLQMPLKILYLKQYLDIFKCDLSVQNLFFYRHCTSCTALLQLKCANCVLKFTTIKCIMLIYNTKRHYLRPNPPATFALL